MSIEEFNEESEKPDFISKPNPLVPRSYHIFQYKDHNGEYEPIGEYTVLDQAEEQELSDKRVTNLISLMNGRKRTLDLKNLTNQRIFFTILSNKPEDDQIKIMFRSKEGGPGITKENAILVLEKGVFDDFQA